MSKKIEVGMMVKIVGITDPDIAIKYEGHVGKVLALYGESSKYGRMFDIDGANPDSLWFPESELQPVED